MKVIQKMREERDNTLQRAVWLAATLGPFRPAELLNKLATNASGRLALAGELAALCAEVKVPGAVLWNLDANARRRAFREMNEAGALQSDELPEFIRTLDPAPDDVFGRHLREALKGNPHDSLADNADFDDQYAAYEFVARSKVGKDPARAREVAGVLEQHVQRAIADQALARTIGPKFVGRKREQVALEHFARTGEVIDPLYSEHAHPVAGQIPVMFLNGVGGAGKSALIAKVARALREEGSGVGTTIIIDFDRPTLAGLHPLELMNEFLRQLSICVPTIARDLLELRRTALTEFSFSEIASSNAISNFRLFQRAMYSVNARLRELTSRAGISHLPMLIILDTFEEVLTLGAEFVWRIYQWVDSLRNEAELQGIRVLLSGRATPEDVNPEPNSDFSPDELRPNLVGAMLLGDLDRPEAVELLQSGEVGEPVLAAKVYERFGGNPLALRLVNDYARQHGAEGVRELLTGEGEHREEYQAEFVQRVLYSRILGRIRNDPALRALASPGLFVRVVTPGVIEKVLAVPCGLVYVTEDQAADLFRRLARQVWLVKRTGDWSVAHRRDMRSIMLPLAYEPGGGRTREEIVEIAEAIHRNAVAYHRGTPPDSALSPEVSRQEALYHELFVDPEAALTNPHLASTLPNLVGDLGDFPIATRARLKRRLERALSPDEVAALEADERGVYQAQQAAQKISRTGVDMDDGADPAPVPTDVAFEAGAAADLGIPGASGSTPGGTGAAVEYAAEDEGSGGSGTGYAQPAPHKPKKSKSPRAMAGDSNRVITAYTRGEFESVAEAAPTIILEFMERAISRRGVRLERDMTEHVTWLAAISTLALPWRRKQNDWRIELADEICGTIANRFKPLSTFQLEDHSRLTVAHYLTAVAMLVCQTQGVGERAQKVLRRLGRDGVGATKINLATTAAIRIFQMFAAADLRAEFTFPVSEVGADCLQFFAGWLDPAAIKRRSGSMIAAQAAWEREQLSLRELNDLLESTGPVGVGNVPSAKLAEIERKAVRLRADLYDWQHPRAPLGPKTLRRLLTLPWAAMRGMSPELQAPMLAALRARMQDSTERQRLLVSLAKCSKKWPVDFAFSAKLNEQPSDTFIASLAHFADRFAALPILFEGVPANSMSANVGRVHSTLDRLIASVTVGAAKRIETRRAAHVRKKKMKK